MAVDFPQWLPGAGAAGLLALGVWVLLRVILDLREQLGTEREQLRIERERNDELTDQIMAIVGAVRRGWSQQRSRLK